MELHTVLDNFCEDLLSSGQLQWADSWIEIAEADTQTAGEAIVLTAAVEHWGSHREMLRSPDRDALSPK